MSSNVLGSVYFIEATKARRIKIGWTEDLWARLDNLRTASPVRLQPLGFIPGTRQREAAIHREFGAHRVHGEWFKSHVYLRDFIRENAQPWPEKGHDQPWGIFWQDFEAGAGEGIHDVRCRLCANIIPAQTEAYRYKSNNGKSFVACERCTRTKQGWTRRIFRFHAH